MKISIITPCYNASKYIAETIESVVTQKGDFYIEYIIIDGMSVDGTQDIINTYIRDIEEKKIKIKCKGIKIKFISQKDTGMYDALAKGFLEITGDIVAYINSDDYYLANAFSTIADVFSKYDKVKWITGYDVIFNEFGQITACSLPYIYESDLIRKGVYGTKLPFIQQESTFWRREILQYVDVNILKKYKYAGDFYMWYSFSSLEQLYIIQSCLGGFRVRKGQLSSEKTLYLDEMNRGVERIDNGDDIRIEQILNNWYLPNYKKRELNKDILYFNNSKLQWILEG